MCLYELWDFLDARGRNIILEWVKDERLTKRSRAMLNQKIRRLSQVDYDLALKTKLLAQIYKHVHKLKIHSDVMLRPMLCRGPIDNSGEYTFLLGAIEIGGDLPKESKKKAEEHRSIILKEVGRRQRHEQIPESN